MKVYVVIGESGEYEDYREWIAGILPSREMADTFKVECEKQAKYMMEYIDMYDDDGKPYEREYPRYYDGQIPEWGVDKKASYDYTGTSYDIEEYEVIEEF